MHMCGSIAETSGSRVPVRGCPWLAPFAALAILVGCTGDRDTIVQPSFYRDLAEKDAQLDAATAASMISGYRTNNGLTPVTVDAELMKLAEAQAQGMASRDKLDQDATRGLNERLRAQGYRAKAAVANISAGYHTVAEAFSGWRDSPPHRANMLLPGATRMGIAAVYAPKSKFKLFWALILVAPEDPRS
jgi:uncharacterized protein YkwD